MQAAQPVDKASVVKSSQTPAKATTEAAPAGQQSVRKEVTPAASAKPSPDKAKM